MENILKEIGIVLIPPKCFSEKSDMKRLHSEAFKSKNSIEKRMEYYLLGLQLGCNAEFYYSAEVYQVLMEVYRLVSR